MPTTPSTPRTPRGWAWTWSACPSRNRPPRAGPGDRRQLAGSGAVDLIVVDRGGAGAQPGIGYRHRPRRSGLAQPRAASGLRKLRHTLERSCACVVFLNRCATVRKGSAGEGETARGRTAQAFRRVRMPMIPRRRRPAGPASTKNKVAESTRIGRLSAAGVSDSPKARKNWGFQTTRCKKTAENQVSVVFALYIPNRFPYH